MTKTPGEALYDARGAIEKRKGTVDFPPWSSLPEWVQSLWEQGYKPSPPIPVGTVVEMNLPSGSIRVHAKAPGVALIMGNDGRGDWPLPYELHTVSL